MWGVMSMAEDERRQVGRQMHDERSSSLRGQVAQELPQ